MIEIYKKITRIKYVLIIFLETLFIFSLTFYIHFRTVKNDLLKARIAPIEKRYVNCDNSVLQYYCQPKPNVLWQDKTSWMTNPVTYHINSNGFNSNSNYSARKKADTFRILALGDSHTFGLWVNTKENYPSTLEYYLNSVGKCGDYKHFEVLNLGYPGDDPKYSAYRYQQIGERYSQDLIIWYVKRDDFIENVDLLKPIEIACFKNINNTDITNIEDCIKKSYNKYYSDGNFDQAMKQSFTDIYNFISRTKTQILFFTYKDEDNQELNFLNSLTSKNIYLRDNLKHDEISRFTNDEHPNADGYKIIASDLENYILSDILQCR